MIFDNNQLKKNNNKFLSRCRAYYVFQLFHLLYLIDVHIAVHDGVDGER